MNIGLLKNKNIIINKRYLSIKQIYNDKIDPKKTIIKKTLIPRHKIPLEDLVFGNFYKIIIILLL